MLFAICAKLSSCHLVHFPNVQPNQSTIKKQLSQQLFFPSSISFSRTHLPRMLAYFSFPLLVSVLQVFFLIFQFVFSVPASFLVREHFSHACSAPFSYRCLFHLCKGLFRFYSLLLRCRICFCCGRYARFWPLHSNPCCTFSSHADCSLCLGLFSF